MQPSLFSTALKSLSFKLVCLLCFFAATSTFWNDPNVADSRHIRYIINIVLFILAFVYTHSYRPQFIEKALLLSALVWGVYGLFELYSFYYIQDQPLSMRIVGRGSLTNTLLTSHVYGAFASFIAGYYLVKSKYVSLQIFLIFILTTLLIFIIQTHSRTPLVGLCAVFAFLFMKHRNKQTTYFFIILILLFSTYLAFNIELITKRGLSYRPEIWAIAFKDISLKPIFGHGLESSMSFFIPSLQTAFSDSHNIHIAFLYSFGLTGFVIWLSLLGSLINTYKNNANNRLASTGFSILIFGFFAGMTEGGSFLGRPKEVWFLTWLPVAILVAAEIHLYSKNSNETN